MFKVMSYEFSLYIVSSISSSTVINYSCKLKHAISHVMWSIISSTFLLFWFGCHQFFRYGLYCFSCCTFYDYAVALHICFHVFWLLGIAPLISFQDMIDCINPFCVSFT